MIPEPIARLFWDMDPGELDLPRDQHVIVPRVLNYGTLADWNWLERQYGRDALRAEVIAGPRNSVRERSRRLASVLFA